MAKIKYNFYTSYHTVSNANDISTSVGGRGAKTKLKYAQLTPPSVMELKWSEIKTLPSIDAYVELYEAGLKKLNPKQVWKDLQSLTPQGYTPTILCYCKYDDFCHRFIVAKWLGDELGLKWAEKSIVEKPELKGWTFNDWQYCYEPPKS